MIRTNKDKMFDSIKFYFAFNNSQMPEWEETNNGLLNKKNGMLFIYCDEKSDTEIKELIKCNEKAVLCTLDKTKEKRLKNISSSCGIFMYADIYGFGMTYKVELERKSI